MTAETYSYFGVGGAILALLVPIIQLLINTKEKGWKRITTLGWWMLLIAVYIGVISCLTIRASSSEQKHSQKELKDSIVNESKIQDSITRIVVIDSINAAISRSNHNISITYNSITNSYIINNNSALRQRHFTDQDLSKMLKDIPKTVSRISIEIIGDERESFVFANEMKDKLVRSGYNNISLSTVPLSTDFQNIYDKFIQWPTNVNGKDTIQWGILIYPSSLQQSSIPNFAAADQKLTQSFDDLDNIDYTKAMLARDYITNNFPDTLSDEQGNKLLKFIKHYGYTNTLADLLSYQRKSIYLTEIFKFIVSKEEADLNAWRYLFRSPVSVDLSYVISIIESKPNYWLKYANIVQYAMESSSNICASLLNSEELIDFLLAHEDATYHKQAVDWLNKMIARKASYEKFRNTRFFQKAKLA
jgi:hypothetical protein